MTNVSCWSESFKARDHLEDQGVDEMIILTYILQN